MPNSESSGPPQIAAVLQDHLESLQEMKIEPKTSPRKMDVERLRGVDLSDREQLIGLFPKYIQELFALRKQSKKMVVNNAVNIENFSMKTPYGDRYLLQNTKLVLEPNRRLGLIGANATGKTLLFTNIVSGAIKDFPKHLHVHHCKELETHELSESVLDTVIHSHPYRNILFACEDGLKAEMAITSDEDRKAKLKENLDFVNQQVMSIKGRDVEERASKMLRVLGFDDVGQKKLCSSLSGGLRMRVALCIAFMSEADLLFLDEPTNHLDFPSVLWLENRLRGFKGSFLLVSHDRELLNNVCTSILMLEDKQIKYYNFGFKEFELKKGQDDAKKASDVEKFLKRNPNPDMSTPLGKEKYEKKEWLDAFQTKQVALQGKFTFPAATALENNAVDEKGEAVAADDIPLIDLKDVRFSYDASTGHFIFNDPISFKVTATTRVGVMGPNGAGKSTLLKLLTHKLTPTEGTVAHHPKFTLAYFGQHSTAELNMELTAIEFMSQQFPKETSGKLRSHLAKTGVVGHVQDTRMQGLSFSQRSCIVFAKLTYICPHLLILDEPTNFLDLESVDSLIGACNKYKGALLLVSHNRDFLKRCAKAYLSVVPGHFKLYDKLKAAENATYTFIAEMEEGGKVGKDALVNTPGGGSIHATQKVETKQPAPVGATPAPVAPVVKPAEEKKVMAASTPAGAKPVAAAQPAPTAPAAAAAAVKYEVNEKCEALWKDGKYYGAQVKKVKGVDEYVVLYTKYGNTSVLSSSSLRKAGTAKKGGK